MEEEEEYVEGHLLLLIKAHTAQHNSSLILRQHR
jgi:hypothetical protein